MIKVAIVEDHQMVREGLKVLINQSDEIEVVAEFNNAKDWLKSLTELHFDVSLIDIDLPELDGITALDEALLLDKHLKAIMLTMHNDVTYFREAFVKGAQGFVLKDMSVNELSIAIREVHNGNTFFSDEFLKSLANNLRKEQNTTMQQKKTDLYFNESEHRLLSYICKGFTNKELAEALFLSVKTIESHKAKLMRKTATKNNAGLIVWAIKNQVVDV